MIRLLRIGVALVAALLLTAGAAEADTNDVPEELRKLAPSILREATAALATAEGAQEFNLDSEDDITFGPLHRIYVAGGTPEQPDIVPIDEWIVAVYQRTSPSLRITLHIDETGQYAFGEAAASNDMDYLATIDRMASREKLVYIPISNSFFAVDPAADAVRGINVVADDTPRTTRELVELEAMQHTAGDRGDGGYLSEDVTARGILRPATMAAVGAVAAAVVVIGIIARRLTRA